jgi:hypothetical protein
MSFYVLIGHGAKAAVLAVTLDKPAQDDLTAMFTPLAEAIVDGDHVSFDPDTWNCCSAATRCGRSSAANRQGWVLGPQAFYGCTETPSVRLRSVYRLRTSNHRSSDLCGTPTVRSGVRSELKRH